MRLALRWDWQRLLARPGQLGLPLLVFLTPLLILPLISVEAQIDTSGRLAVLWLLLLVAQAAGLDDILWDDWRAGWPDAWLAAGHALWIYLLAKLFSLLAFRLLPLVLALWLGGILWGIPPSLTQLAVLLLLLPGMAAGLLLVASLSLGSRRAQAAAPLTLLPLGVAPLMLGLSTSLLPSLGGFALCAAWSLANPLVLLPLSSQLLRTWLAER